MKIGFIGLGLMGNLMAKNILKSGFDLTVYNRTSTKTEEFKKLGAKVVVEKNKGHFTAEDGVRKLPSALKSVLEIAGQNL